jgi:protein-S-isoprenylcysteine O-methyltransferase Ste14
MALIHHRDGAFIIIAAVVLFLQLPVPMYWFIVHPNAQAWRRHKRTALISAALVAWGSGAIFLFFMRHYFYAPTTSPARAITGCTLIVAELYLFLRASSDLGYERLTGETELSGGGEIMDAGIYAHIRNPRYTGSFLAILGACLIAGARCMWLTGAIWAALMLAAILLEEREMRGRFGAAYIDYCRRVPRFLPRFLPRAAEIPPDARL